jgi:ASCH domain
MCVRARESQLAAESVAYAPPYRSPGHHRRCSFGAYLTMATDEAPVLTVRQPWAWAIIHGGKDVENRSWRTKYRGPLLIHAGSAFEPDGYETVMQLATQQPPPAANSCTWRRAQQLQDHGRRGGVTQVAAACGRL